MFGGDFLHKTAQLQMQHSLNISLKSSPAELPMKYLMRDTESVCVVKWTSSRTSSLSSCACPLPLVVGYSVNCGEERPSSLYGLNAASEASSITHKSDKSWVTLLFWADFSLLSQAPGALCSSAAEPDTSQAGHLQQDALRVPLGCPGSTRMCGSRCWDIWGDLSTEGAATVPGGGGCHCTLLVDCSVSSAPVLAQQAVSYLTF